MTRGNKETKHDDGHLGSVHNIARSVWKAGKGLREVEHGVFCYKGFVNISSVEREMFYAVELHEWSMYTNELSCPV